MQLSHLLLVFLATSCLSAQAQPVALKTADERLAPVSETRCRKDVNDYVDAMRFVRQAAGEQIGNRVAKGYVSEDVLSRLTATQGPCAAAQLLRDKGASR